MERNRCSVLCLNIATAASSLSSTLFSHPPNPTLRHPFSSLTHYNPPYPPSPHLVSEFSRILSDHINPQHDLELSLNALSTQISPYLVEQKFFYKERETESYRKTDRTWNGDAELKMLRKRMRRKVRRAATRKSCKGEMQSCYTEEDKEEGCEGEMQR
ncbi:hypothetical protein ACFX2J_034380 [Malus domestica]